MYLNRKAGFYAAVLMMVFALSACGKAAATEDASQKITEIALTVQAELTQISALTPTVTPTIAATNTAVVSAATPTLSSQDVAKTVLPTSSGTTEDNAIYVADVTVPDGTIVGPGETFVKTWTIRNTGTTTWTTNYQFVYLEGLLGTNNTYAVNIPKAVAPGEDLDISITFTAPAPYGSYVSYWKMYNSAGGFVFGEQVNVNFAVGVVPTSTTTTTTVTETPTATATTAP